MSSFESWVLYGPSAVVWSGILTYVAVRWMSGGPAVGSVETVRRLVLASLLVLALTTLAAPVLPVSVVLVLSFVAVTTALVSLGGSPPNPSGVYPPSIEADWYAGGLCLALGVALVVRGVGLAESGFIIDERIHAEAAQHFLRSPDFPFWTFFQDPDSGIYDRAWLYTIQIAGLFELFGVGKGVARSVSVAWGLALFVPVLWMGNLLEFTRLERLTAVWWIAVSTFFVTVSRWLRMYSMFLVLFLIWVIVLYKFIRARTRARRITWGTLVVVLGLVDLHLHLLTVTVLPGVLMYIFVKRKPMNWLRQKTGLLALAVLVGLGVFAVPKGLQHLDFEQLVFFNHLYPVILSLDTLGFGIGTIVLLSVFDPREDNDGRVYVIFLLVTTLLFFVFFADRYMAYRYISHLILLAVFPLVWGWYRIIEFVTEGLKRAKLLRRGLVLVGFLMPLVKLRPWLPELWSGYMGSLYTHVRLLGLFGLAP